MHEPSCLELYAAGLIMPLSGLLGFRTVRSSKTQISISQIGGIASMRLPFSPLTRLNSAAKMPRHDTTAPVIARRLQHPVQQAHRRRWSAATTTEESAFAGGRDALRPPWATGLRDSPRISTRCGGAFWPNRRELSRHLKYMARRTDS